MVTLKIYYVHIKVVILAQLFTVFYMFRFKCSCKEKPIGGIY